MRLRRVAACVLLALAVGAGFDRCMIACTENLAAAAEQGAAGACHHSSPATGSAAQVPAASFDAGCQHDHDEAPAEVLTSLRTHRTTGLEMVALAEDVPDVCAACSLTGLAIDGPPLLVTESGSIHRQLRL